VSRSIGSHLIPIHLLRATSSRLRVHSIRNAMGYACFDALRHVTNFVPAALLLRRTSNPEASAAMYAEMRVGFEPTETPHPLSLPTSLAFTAAKPGLLSVQGGIASCTTECCPHIIPKRIGLSSARGDHQVDRATYLARVQIPQRRQLHPALGYAEDQNLDRNCIQAKLKRYRQMSLFPRIRIAPSLRRAWSHTW